MGVDKESVDGTVLSSPMSSEVKSSELQLVDAIYTAKDLTPAQIHDVTIRDCPPPPPLASVKIEKLGTAPNGCQVNILVSNYTTVAWDGVSIHLAFRDNSQVAIGEYQGIPMVYTEPERGIIVGNIIHGISCEQIAAVSLLYFGYYPQNQGQIQVEESSIPTSIQ